MTIDAWQVGDDRGRLALLGGLSAQDFMRRHWQRRPLLVRAALGPAEGTRDHPGLEHAAAAAIDLRLLRRLASNDDVDSRLVTAPGHRPRPGAPASDRWTLRRGPLARLPPLSADRWTLLVQGVDLHLDNGRRLLDRFRFAADARLDDLMVSFATDGGGVGPHADSYDVFLLQLSGRRRWSIAPPIAPATARRAARPRPSPITAGAEDPLHHLALFEPTASWLLEPGDMLYLPPGWGHDGVAAGPCLTASIGFRSPTPAQWLEAIQAALDDDRGGAARRTRPFRDLGAAASDRPAAIPDSLAGALIQWQRRWRPQADVIERALGRMLTEPKPTVWFEADPSRRLARDGVDGIVVDRRTRLLYRGPWIFINGEAVRPPTAAGRWLQRLADRRRLAAADLQRALRHRWLAATLDDWLAAGWIAHASD
jgi:50S ribosomal protein L16 3-hydroxylase